MSVPTGGQAIPENPDFATESERLVWGALRASLADGDVLIHGLRLSDRHTGDVEVDLILLSPMRGAAVVEVKGGHVQFEDGVWTTTNGSGASRRIHPTDQARRAKHALRRYLDRQPQWPWGLLRSQWFLATPFTDVLGDLAPDAPREQVIGKGDLAGIRQIIDEAMDGALREPPPPSEPWVDLAVELILASAPRRSDNLGHKGGHQNRSAVTSIGLLMALTLLASAALGTGLTLAFDWWGALVSCCLMVGALLGLARFVTSSRLNLSWVFATAVTTLMLSCGAVLFLAPSRPTEGPPLPTVYESARADVASCSTAYEPCVLELPADRDCPGIGFRVRLTGLDDPYELDLDNDGSGCEAYPERAEGERAGGL